MDELLGRVMPHSQEAEQAVLGAMLIDPKRVPAVLTILKPSDFYLETNRAVYETILSMFNYAQTIDPITVLEKMRLSGEAAERASRYLVELMNITPTAVNVMEYAKIVADKALLRSVVETSGELVDLVHSGGGSARDVLEVAEKKIYSLRRDQATGGLTPVSQILQDAYAKINEAAKRDQDIPGITTGLPDLDRTIMGLNDSDLIFIASRPGMGKTSIALNLALAAAKHSEKAVAIFSLEMSREQLVTRLLSSESHVDSKKLQTGNLSQEDWKKLGKAAMGISKTNIYIDDNPSLTVSDMNAGCRRIRDLGLVIIDYLQLMTSAGFSQSAYNQNRTQVVSEISRFLKIMAKELNVPVVCLSQLNRASADRKDKRPVLSDLRESGSIEQDADIVLGLFREGYYDNTVENPYLVECLVLKNRHGEVGTVQLEWQPQYTSFIPYVRKEHEPSY